MSNGQQEPVPDRLETALERLSEIPDDSLPELIWDRLSGMPTALPPLARDEDSADIFVDAVVRKQNWDLQARIRDGCAQALKEHGLQGDEKFQPYALGQLLYLCSRIDVTKALPSIRQIFSHPNVFTEVDPGETLLVRAVRAYVGLLAADLKHNRDSDREERYRLDIRILNRLVRHPDCTLVAATGLIGLQPKHTEELLKDLPDYPNLRERINLGLRIAGFAPEDDVAPIAAAGVELNLG
jgi:hypothetical protein